MALECNLAMIMNVVHGYCLASAAHSGGFEPWFISDLYMGRNWSLQSSTLAVSPVSPCTTQPNLVLIGWIPNGYSALCGVGWEISVRPERWPWLLVVQRRMAWPISGSQNSWRAWWRGGWRRYNGQASLNRWGVVDPQFSLWSRCHGWRRVRYHRRDRRSVGEVSSKGLVRHTLYAIARIGLHCSPHVAI